MNKRPWYKWYGMEWIMSETRKKLTHQERSIFRELIDLASYNHVLGRLANAAGKGYGDTEMSELMDLDRRIWLRVKDKLCKIGAIRIHKNGVIDITNYWNFQPTVKDRTDYHKARNDEVKALREQLNTMKTQS